MFETYVFHVFYKKTYLFTYTRRVDSSSLSLLPVCSICPSREASACEGTLGVRKGIWTPFHQSSPRGAVKKVPDRKAAISVIDVLGPETGSRRFSSITVITSTVFLKKSNVHSLPTLRVHATDEGEGKRRCWSYGPWSEFQEGFRVDDMPTVRDLDPRRLHDDDLAAPDVVLHDDDPPHVDDVHDSPARPDRHVPDDLVDSSLPPPSRSDHRRCVLWGNRHYGTGGVQRY